LDNISVKAF